MAATSRPSTMSAASVPITFLLVNALSYALLLVAAHVLSKSDYGELSSLLGLLLISTIPMLALQTVAARRAATQTESNGIVRGTAVVGGIATLVLVLLSPALAAFLHLPDLIGILLVAATVPAGAVLGSAMGIAQGRRQFARLALLIVAATGGRSACGLVGLALGRSSEATLLGVVVGMSGAALVVAASGPGFAAHRVALRDRRPAGVLSETAGAAVAHGTFLLLTTLDVLLARHVLSSSAAGVYAVGSVVTRAAVWLPQSIVALMFASLATTGHHRRSARRASVVVLGLGAALVAGTATLGPLVVTFVGGAKYHALDDSIGLYALLGALLAVLQLSVLAGLAQRTARRAAVLWATIVVDVAVVLAAEDAMTPTRLVVTLSIVAGAAAAVALWLTVREPGLTVAQPVSPEGHGPGV
jgi:O-antigen/teichoic acid export membrane protein